MIRSESPNCGTASNCRKSLKLLSSSSFPFQLVPPFHHRLAWLDLLNLNLDLSLSLSNSPFSSSSCDASWWKVRVKQPPSSGASPADAPTGLVPAGYLVPVPAIRTVTAAYDYEATGEEELSIQEGQTYDLYEDDGEWSLVGATGGRKEVGFAPSAYFEEADGDAAAVSALYVSIDL